MKKTNLAIFLIALSLFCLVGCSNESENQGNTEATTLETFISNFKNEERSNSVVIPEGLEPTGDSLKLSLNNIQEEATEADLEVMGCTSDEAENIFNTNRDGLKNMKESFTTLLEGLELEAAQESETLGQATLMIIESKDLLVSSIVFYENGTCALSIEGKREYYKMSEEALNSFIEVKDAYVSSMNEARACYISAILEAEAEAE